MPSVGRSIHIETLSAAGTIPVVEGVDFAVCNLGKRGRSNRGGPRKKNALLLSTTVITQTFTKGEKYLTEFFGAPVSVAGMENSRAPFSGYKVAARFRFQTRRCSRNLRAHWRGRPCPDPCPDLGWIGPALTAERPREACGGDFDLRVTCLAGTMVNAPWRVS